MLVLSNGLTDTADEGFLKVASSLIKQIKNKFSNSIIVTYERKTNLSDHHIELNKLFLNKELFSLLRNNDEAFLYIPFPAKMFATALRLCVLGVVSKQKVNAILVMTGKVDFITKILFKICKANIFVLSEEAKSFYTTFISKDRVYHLKAGVDTKRFCPVSSEQSNKLRVKYGLSADRPVILHVGHLKEGRNIRQLLSISSDYQVLLVTSTLTKDEQDEKLKTALQQKSSVRIIDSFIPQVYELYQLADVYFFPVVESGNCIDIPLSCLEAAACDLPILTTSYGAMKEFKDKKGFYFINSFENINEILSQIILDNHHATRESVLDFEWEKVLEMLNKMI